jgi:hypothetical protein
MLPFVLGALYIGLVGTPWENTLTLAAENRLDLKAAFFYRYRDVSLLGGFGAATPAVSAIMTLIGIFGSRILFISICLATGALVLRRALRLRLLMLLPVTAGLAFGEAFLLWSLLIALLSHGYARIRQRRAVTLLVALARYLCNRDGFCPDFSWGVDFSFRKPATHIGSPQGSRR